MFPSSLRRRLTDFDELGIARKLIELLTEVQKNEGYEMAMSLLHPGEYLNKHHGAKYEIAITSVAYKFAVSEVMWYQR